MGQRRSGAGRRLPPDEVISRLRQVLSLLADTGRLRMALALARHGDLGVPALKELAGKSSPVVSHDLTLMRLAGLVSCRAEGKERFYRLQWGLLRDVLGQVFAEAGGPRRELRLGRCSLAFRTRK
jgi:DNA-binding transcriptional ArsR family regulator